MEKTTRATNLCIVFLLFSLSATPAAVTEAWVRRYNAPANSDDRAQAVAVDKSGNVVVTGGSYNSSGNADHYTAKYAATNGALTNAMPPAPATRFYRLVTPRQGGE